MNERIRELAEQADRWAQKMTRSDDPRYGDRPVSDLFDEKFAELIVRECCDWIDGSPATDAGTLLLTKSFITVNLKGHFGVKE